MPIMCEIIQRCAQNILQSIYSGEHACACDVCNKYLFFQNSRLKIHQHIMVISHIPMVCVCVGGGDHSLKRGT
jgi:hypothetical protein